jgi:hypothetical protein
MKKFLLIVTLILVCFFNSKAQVAAINDYRTVASGSWHAATTWQVRTGVNTWVATSTPPTSSNNVYIQIGHLITVTTADAACKDLHVYNNAAALTINAAFNVNVSGKLRAMIGQTAAEIGTGADGTYTGTSTATAFATGMIATSSTGLLRFVGASRPIIVLGEWTASGNSHNTEFALDPGAVGTLADGYKCKKLIVSSGSITASKILACNTATAITDTSVVIRNGAKLTTSVTTTGTTGGYAIAGSSSAKCNLIVIQSGGILEFTGATPNISTAKFVNSGTILYTSTVAQSLLQNILQGTTLDITVPLTTAQLNTNTAGVGGYNNIQISGAVAHTVTAQSAISISGSLQIDAGVTLDMNVAGYDITGALTSVNNNGTIKTYSTSAAPIPAGKDWQGLGAAGTVNYALPSGTTGQTVVTGTYKNLSISNTNGNTGRTTFQAGIINISGNFTVAAPSTSTTNVVTGNTINFTNPNGGQTIAATNYNNLNITTNTSVNQSLANGTFYILGAFNPGSYPFVFYQTPGANPNGFNFYNATGGQNIPKFNYANLTVSNTSGNTTVAADTIGVSGVYTPGVGTYNLTPTIGNTFIFNLAAGGQNIPAFNYYNLIISDASASSSNNTITSDINVTNSVRLTGKFGILPSAFKIIYGANATLFYNGASTLTTFKTSPFWPETSGPTNVTVNSGTLQFEQPARTDTITNVQLTNGTATITTASPHLFAVGNSVTLGGLNTSEYGFVFGGTFTISAVTANTFSFTLSDTNIAIRPVVGGVALANVTRSIPGTLRLDGGRLKVNAGNFLRMGGGSTIIRNSDISKLTLSNGFLALGNSSTDKVNITIGATMFDDNEFTSFTSPGGYGTLTLNAGIRYNLSGSRTIVDLNALGASQLSLKDTSTFSINGNILASSTGTISGKPNANLYFGGANAGALTTPLKFTTDSNSLGILRISRTGTGAQIQLATNVKVNQFLQINAGSLLDNGNIITLAGTLNGLTGASHVSSGSGKIVMTGENQVTHTILGGAYTLGNLEINSGSVIVTDSTSFNIANNLTITNCEFATNGATPTISLTGNLNGTGTASFTGSGKIKMITGGTSISVPTVSNIDINPTVTSTTITAGSLTNISNDLFLTTGTFNIGTADVLVGGDINGAGIVNGTGKIKMTGNNKNIIGNPSLINLEVASGAAINGSTGCSVNISGTLTMNGGDIVIRNGNTLLMKNNSTIIRNSGDINTNTGTMTIGEASNNIMNLFINSSLTSSNELPGSTTGKVDLTIANGVTYTLKSNNKTVRNLTLSDGGLATNSLEAPLVYSLASTDNVTVLGNFSLASPLIAQGAFKFGNVSTKTFASNGFLNLRSRKSGTAYVADVTNNGANSGNTISGDVWTERFISNVKNTTLDTGRSLKAWRLLSPATNHNTQTINAAWQEGGAGNTSNPNPGYGTNMSGPGAGFDQAGGTSLKVFDVSTQAWAAVPSTLVNFEADKAYMVFIRGSRAKYQFLDIPDTTILREKGELNIGNITVAVGTGANQFVAVANPYASAINYSSLQKSGLTSFYYLYDPRVGTSGGWTTIANDGSPTPPSQTYVNNTNTQIQSGQGFMVKTGSAGAGSITFKEISKYNGSANVLRENQVFSSFRTNVYKMTNGVAEIVDGVTQMLDVANANELNEEDASKMVNTSENFALMVNNKQLSIETRKPFLLSDTINYNMTQMKQATYQLQFVPQNTNNTNLKPILLDQYLQTETELSFASITTYNFVVTNNGGANSINRFKIVFRPMVTLPVSFVDVKAAVQSKQVNVTWNVGQEVNIQRYSILRSGNGLDFSEIGNVDAMQLSNYQFADQYPVKGNLYYKIKSIGIDGSVQYSKIASVKFGSNANSITISPNPVGKDGIFYIFGLTNNGLDIQINLFDASGRKVYHNKVFYINENQIRVVLPKSINAGVYQICLNGTGLSICKSLIIK